MPLDEMQSLWVALDPVKRWYLPKIPQIGSFFMQNAEMKHMNERTVSHFSVI